MNSMKVVELKSLARERGLRGYSKLRKAELINLLESTPADQPIPQPPVPHPRPVPQQVPKSVLHPRPVAQQISDYRKILPSEMDIFEKSEMAKERSMVKTKLTEWYDWLIDHVPKQIKDRASSVFRSAKRKILNLFDKDTTDEDSPKKDTDSKIVFTPIEEAFNKAYRRFRINSDSKVDVETFLNKIRSKLIDLISNQLDEMNSAKIQFILWLKFRKQEGNEEIQVDKAFNSKITEFFQASDFNELIDAKCSLTSKLRSRIQLYQRADSHWIRCCICTLISTS